MLVFLLAYLYRKFQSLIISSEFLNWLMKLTFDFLCYLHFCIIFIIKLKVHKSKIYFRASEKKNKKTCHFNYYMVQFSAIKKIITPYTVLVHSFKYTKFIEIYNVIYSAETIVLLLQIIVDDSFNFILFIL